jgi:predicted glycogen debranching enzyme
MSLLSFGPDVCRDLDAASSREWLETDGLGGYALSTVASLNTRRYHGLLVAATTPPAGRSVLLSGLDETLVTPAGRVELSTHRYSGLLHPEGWRHLVEFRLDPFPTWIFEAANLRLEKSLFLAHGTGALVVSYRLFGGAARLELRPLIAFRDHHALTHENDALDGAVAVEEGLASVAPYPGLPRLFVAHDGALVPTGTWYRAVEYEEERRRGFDFTEDLFQPFLLTFELGAGRGATLVASTRRRRAADAGFLRGKEMGRRVALAGSRPTSDAASRLLALASDRFLAARGRETTLLAGYPWFADWGRDAMISLPGLTLATARPGAAQSILLTFARHAENGLLPNRFPDSGGSAEFGSADASLWFVEAVRAYLEATGDADFVRIHLWEVLKAVAAAHVEGTRHGLRVDEDGLLASGQPDLALTWMDARASGEPVTPRRGKPVEVQALWYNALRVLEDLARRFAAPALAARFGETASRAARSFLPLFWNPDTKSLHDAVDGASRDPSIRPNQILAVSLPHSMLDAARSASVLEVVTRELRTPFGLRTLSPKDPAYRGRYEGGPDARDRAYHQGTVWPWLLGPWVDAFLRVKGDTPRVRAEALAALRPLLDFLLAEGVGQLPEVFDGDPPHRPGGCPAQAWSVAEVLRALARVSR